jgi:hypothetical protein
MSWPTASLKSGSWSITARTPNTVQSLAPNNLQTAAAFSVTFKIKWHKFVNIIWHTPSGIEELTGFTEEESWHCMVPSPANHRNPQPL